MGNSHILMKPAWACFFFFLSLTASRLHLAAPQVFRAHKTFFFYFFFPKRLLCTDSASVLWLFLACCWPPSSFSFRASSWHDHPARKDDLAWNFFRSSTLPSPSSREKSNTAGLDRNLATVTAQKPSLGLHSKRGSHDSIHSQIPLALFKCGKLMTFRPSTREVGTKGNGLKMFRAKKECLGFWWTFRKPAQ